MLIRNLPPKIKELAIKRIKEQRYDLNENKSLFISFIWKNTPEGQNYWSDISIGNFIEPIYSDEISKPNMITKLRNKLWKILKSGIYVCYKKKTNKSN